MVKLEEVQQTISACPYVHLFIKEYDNRAGEGSTEESIQALIDCCPPSCKEVLSCLRFSSLVDCLRAIGILEILWKKDDEFFRKERKKAEKSLNRFKEQVKQLHTLTIKESTMFQTKTLIGQMYLKEEEEWLQNQLTLRCQKYLNSLEALKKEELELTEEQFQLRCIAELAEEIKTKRAIFLNQK